MGRPKIWADWTDEQLVRYAQDNPIDWPYFPLYQRDIIANEHIRRMSPAEVGAYFLLLCNAWQNKDCGLPNEERALAIYSQAGNEWRKLKGSVLERFFEWDNRLYNRKLLRLRSEAVHTSVSRKESRAKRT